MTAQPEPVDLPPDPLTTLAYWHHYLESQIRDKTGRPQTRQMVLLSVRGAGELRDCIGVALGYRK